MNSSVDPVVFQPSNDTLLNALEGVAYICCFDGVVLAVGKDNWSEFAASNAAPQLADVSGLIGTNVFDHVSGRDVIDSYRACFATISSGRSRSVSFTFRCDAPDLRRDMRMCLSGVYMDGRPRAVLFQSLMVEERERPSVSLFDYKKLMAVEGQLPIVSLCSFCHDIKLKGTWMTAEQYYVQGGVERVRISHGICPRCHRTKIPACDAA